MCRLLLQLRSHDLPRLNRQKSFLYPLAVIVDGCRHFLTYPRHLLRAKNRPKNEKSDVEEISSPSCHVSGICKEGITINLFMYEQSLKKGLLSAAILNTILHRVEEKIPGKISKALIAKLSSFAEKNFEYISIVMSSDWE